MTSLDCCTKASAVTTSAAAGTGSAAPATPTPSAAATANGSSRPARLATMATHQRLGSIQRDTREAGEQREEHDHQVDRAARGEEADAACHTPCALQSPARCCLRARHCNIGTFVQHPCQSGIDHVVPPDTANRSGAGTSG